MTVSVYPISHRDTRSTVMNVNGFLGESPNSRKLVLTTEEFNCVGLFKSTKAQRKRKSSSDECEKSEKLLTNVS